MLIWNDPSRPVAARFGIAGDFLPSSGLSPAGSDTWPGMAEQLRESFRDLAFSLVNLECPVDVGTLQPRLKTTLGDTFSAPRESLDYLRALKCKAVSLANNHMYDYGAAGIQTTRAALSTAGIASLGAGRTLEDSPEVSVIPIGDSARIGIWCAALALRECSTMNSRGIEPATLDRGNAALSQLRSLGATCSVALLHAGAERTNRPDPNAVKLMDGLAQAGFDLVAACHSHRTSGYHDIVRPTSPHPAFCFYGLGSLSSGVIYSDLEREGLLAVVGINSDGNLASVEAKPIFLGGPGWGAVPSPPQADSILGRFLSISLEVLNGSYEHGFYQDAGKDLLRTHWSDLQLAFSRAGLRGIFSKLTRLRFTHIRTLMHKGFHIGRSI
jgi:hypothetical protein